MTCCRKFAKLIILKQWIQSNHSNALAKKISAIFVHHFQTST